RRARAARPRAAARARGRHAGRPAARARGHQLRDARGRGHRAAAATRPAARRQGVTMMGRRLVAQQGRPGRSASCRSAEARLAAPGARTVPARLLAPALALALGLAPAHANATAAPSMQEPTGRGVERTAEGVSLDFQDADLRVVIATLAQVAGLNAVLSDLPNRTVTLRTSRPVQPAEVRGYLESVVRAQGLEMTEEGGLVRIAGSDSAGVAGGGARQLAATQRAVQRGQVQLYVHPLRHARAEALAQTVSALFGVAAGGLAAEPRPRSLTEELRAQRERPIEPGQAVQEPQPGAAPGAQEQ